MKFNIQGIGVKINERITSHCEQKISKFERSLSERDAIEAKFTAEKNTVRCELTLKVSGHFYRAEATSNDVLVAFDQTLDLIERRLRKHKTKVLKHHQGQSIKDLYSELPETDLEAETTDELRISKHKQFNIEMMTEEEAALQMELLGHSFFLYLNPKTGKVNVIYQRKSGEYGNLEPVY